MLFKIVGGEEMKKILKERFDLWIKMRWLKAINKEVDKYNKISNKAKRQSYVVHSMWQRFNELYPNKEIK